MMPEVKVKVRCNITSGGAGDVGIPEALALRCPPLAPMWAGAEKANEDETPTLSVDDAIAKLFPDADNFAGVPEAKFVPISQHQPLVAPGQSIQQHLQRRIAASIRSLKAEQAQAIAATTIAATFPQTNAIGPVNTSMPFGTGRHMQPGVHLGTHGNALNAAVCLQLADLAARTEIAPLDSLPKGVIPTGVPSDSVSGFKRREDGFSRVPSEYSAVLCGNAPTNAGPRLPRTASGGLARTPSAGAGAKAPSRSISRTPSTTSAGVGVAEGGFSRVGSAASAASVNSCASSAACEDLKNSAACSAEGRGCGKRIAKRRPWSAEEHERFVESLQRFGQTNKLAAGGKIQVGLGPGVAEIIAVVVGTRTVSQVRSHAQKYFLGLSKAAKLKLKPGARDNRTTESVASKSAGAHMELETATEDSLKKCPVAATAATDATTVVAATVAAANP